MMSETCPNKLKVETFVMSTSIRQFSYRLLLTACVWSACLIGVMTFFSSFADAADRGRVIIQNGTVYTDRGTPIRGSTSAVLYGVGKSLNQTYWEYLNKTLKLNAVRLDVKTGQIGRSVQQQIPYIDNAVNTAAAHDMYVMILNSIQPGSYDINQLKKFWSAVAPRYANRTHVLYEMTNEPVNGSPVWGNAPQYTDTVIKDLKIIYNIMRRGAPNTHIAMFTAPNLFPDCATYAAMLANVQGVDWTKTSVGFHHYQGTERFGKDNILCLRQKYPLLLTETNYWMRPQFSNLRYALNLYEKLNMSWFSLDGTVGTSHLQYEIIPQLAQDGYSWGVGN